MESNDPVTRRRLLAAGAAAAAATLVPRHVLGGLGDMGIHNIAPVFSALKLGAPECVSASSTAVFAKTLPTR